MANLHLRPGSVKPSVGRAREALRVSPRRHDKRLTAQRICGIVVLRTPREAQMDGAGSEIICPSCRATLPAIAAPCSHCHSFGAHGIPSGELDRFSSYQGWLVAGRYLLLKMLGRGGMGVVYRAQGFRPSRMVAVKLLDTYELRQKLAGAVGAEQEAIDLLRSMFLREAQVQADMPVRASFPAIWEHGVHRCDELGEDFPYIAMQLLDDAEPLDRLLKKWRNARTPVRTALALLAQVSRAMATAHEHGVVHRDLKPQNVLVRDAGQNLDPYIIDFGLARPVDRGMGATLSGLQVFGTPGYLPPEAALREVSEEIRRGLAPDFWHLVDRPDMLAVQGDVYAIGAMLFEILVGRQPYDMREWRTAICQSELDPLRVQPDPLAAWPEMRQVVAQAMAWSPLERFASAADLARHLERLLATPQADRPMFSVGPPTEANAAQPREVVTNPYAKRAEQLPPVARPAQFAVPPEALQSGPPLPMMGKSSEQPVPQEAPVVLPGPALAANSDFVPTVPPRPRSDAALPQFEVPSGWSRGRAAVDAGEPKPMQTAPAPAESPARDPNAGTERMWLIAVVVLAIAALGIVGRFFYALVAQF